ncbi:MAG: hypothetical protein LBJ41_07665 [Treponema sp.]|jgi:hypothetical protein|nr:hypothetical protein [Treponema sp.]
MSYREYLLEVHAIDMPLLFAGFRAAGLETVSSWWVLPYLYHSSAGRCFCRKQKEEGIRITPWLVMVSVAEDVVLAVGNLALYVNQTFQKIKNLIEPNSTMKKITTNIDKLNQLIEEQTQRYSTYVHIQEIVQFKVE